MKNGRVIILGGDGFCGWPTTLRLSKQGYEILIVDDLTRRKIDVELGIQSLTPISTINTRIDTWEELTGKRIQYRSVNIAEDYAGVLAIIKEFEPQAIVHFAEQRAAPYSMKSPAHKRFTVNNNLNATHNVLCAIVESGLDVHLVHLGTMGVYGYGSGGLKITEGYLKVQVESDGENRELDILYPADPGSVYHMTKTQDALFFYYYNKNDEVRVTDLHQGIVWGTLTDETKLDERLINRFDYDGDFGTVLNRFLVQAAIKHPLTVHGTGGQTRAFININDTVQCIQLAIENPPQKGDRVKILNQVTETHSILELANIVSHLSGAEVRQYKNPRKESVENTLEVENKQFLDLGLNPVKLSEGLLEEVIHVAENYSYRVDLSKIISTSLWRGDFVIDRDGKRMLKEDHKVER